MKFGTILAATVAVLSSAAEAQYARIYNNCPFPAWVQSYPYDPHAPLGPLKKLEHLDMYHEKYKPSGSTLKLARDKELSTPLFAGYSETTTPFKVYYEFKDIYGNPFINYPNELLPGRRSCQAFRCLKGEHSPDCYSSGETVYNCPRPTNITVNLCGNA